MANLGLLGAVAGFGQGLQTLGQDIVRRREQALDWARREAEYQRRRVDTKEDQQASFEQQKEITTLRETEANKRNQADIEARAAERADDRKFKVEEREDEQKYQLGRDEASRTAERNLTKLKSQLDAENDAKNTKLKQQLEAGDVAGVKYGERYSVNPKSGRPYSDPKSPYSELILVKKNGEIVHTGKLILAPQNRSGQDEDPSSNGY